MHTTPWAPREPTPAGVWQSARSESLERETRGHGRGGPGFGGAGIVPVAPQLPPFRYPAPVILASRVALLEARLSRLPSLLVALSGGVDSAVLLGTAAGALPGRVLAATTASPAVPPEEIAEAKALAARFRVPHHVVETHEMGDARYRANAGDRCYFCRREMYGALLALARQEGIAHVGDGLQADDSVLERPGVRAAAEAGILHPLREAGLGKSDIRRLARGFGLALFDKPAQPCLSSRLPVGVEVTVERLARVHRAEKALRALGFRELRVRCEDAGGRIEIGAAELERGRALRAEIEKAVVAAGFSSAWLDPGGYAPGRATPS